ncbi:MAG: Xaa-Pro dipeptidase, partial [Bdellovibrionales bacterium]|nr:Xaa-Pro dipeptidase [Bdellovibrionales bacterium]
ELPTLLKDVKRVFYTFGIHEAMDSKIINLLQQQKNLLGRSHQGLLPIFDLSLALGEMRLIKHPEEIIFQRKSCEYSARAHLELMKLVKPHMNEREAQALIDSAFMREGCQRLAYPSIVAGGSNAAYLHYVQNNQELRENDALLVDAGGEYGYYAADITRTFPIGKQFTKAQSDLYDVVFEAQKQAIDLVKPGCLIEDIQATTVGVIVEGLLNLGLLKGKKEEIIEKGEYRRFYPHRASHWLGMDVHDVGLYEIDGKSRCLEPGMVFTIEPGIYCQSYDTSVPHEFVGIGIRIEDDILVTPSGNEVLTNAAPKVRKEIEQIRSDL